MGVTTCDVHLQFTFVQRPGRNAKLVVENVFNVHVRVANLNFLIPNFNISLS